MEVEVRTAPDLRDCFVALPLYFIQALQAGRHALPSLVVLELRPLDNSACWHLAWAGAGSRSSSIEVSEKLADCIGLADGIRVSVRALMDVAKAKTVVLEPAGEDDWEILELNAEYVEDHILSQVGILCAGQLFPVLVQGQNALILRVVSTTPKPVVQLVPGAELVVTPKQRKQMHLPSGSLHGKLGNLSDQSFVPSVKAWLRVQELDSSLVQARELEGFQFHIVPTTAIFASSTTAKAIPFINGQLVVLSSAHVPQKKKNNHESSNKLNSGGAKHRLRPESGDREEDSGDDRYAVLRLVYSDLVARGHVMISSALRLFIGARLHSRVLLRACSQEPNRVQPSIFISPIGFKSKKKVISVDVNDGSNELSRTNGNFERFQNLEELPEGIHDESAQEWERHNELFMMTADISNVPLEAPWVSMAEDENTLENIGAQKVNTFFKLWATAQMAAISCCEIGQCNSIPMSKEVIMQFQFGSNVVKQRESNYEFLFQSKTVANRSGWKKELSTDVCFAVTLNPRDLQADFNDVKQPPSYKGFFLFEEALLAESNSVLEEHVHNTIEKSFKVKLGQPHHILCLSGSSTEESGGPNLSSLTWLEGPASEALSRLKMQLYPKARENSERLGIPSPGYVLLHGPPACGKTKLALAIARQLQEDPSVLAHKVYVRCAELAGEQARTVRATIQEAISEAVEHAPSLIVLDDLDAAIPSGASSESLEPSTTAIMLSEFLADLLDISQVHVKNRIGASISFLAVARAVSTLPACLCFSGRFDFHVALPAPATTELVAIISQELLQRGLSCQDYIVAEIAAKCDGYDAMDLEVLVDRAVHVAAGRFLASPLPELALISSNQVHMNCQKGIGNLSGKKWMMKDMLLQKFELSKEDFSEALKGFVPVSIRGIAKSGGQEGRLGWQDVGGLSDVRKTLIEMLELPVKHSKIFAGAPLRLRSGVLLYGPPGCGKTHIVGAAASACSLRFISVKGPELLNKYIGASEQAVRDVFAKASAAAPCILFFDEFDAIAPKRGHDNTGVTDRVVNQFLTELDGVEALNGVFVFAATSRPDLLDAALLRPGRLDRLLFCNFPSTEERLEILQVLARKLPLSEDVNLEVLATLTEGFSGADLQALLSDAQLEAVHRFLNHSQSNQNSISTKAGCPLITMAVLSEAVKKARPSVPEREKRRLYEIYDVFLTGRSTVVGKTRDVKGKRVTLA